MATTSHGLPLIDSLFAPDAPNQMNSLAQAVDLSLPVVSTTAPAHKSGLIWYDPSTSLTQFSNGSSWTSIVTPLPAWTAIGGFAAGANAGTPTPQYRVRVDGMVEMRGQVTAGTQFAGSGVVLFTAAVGARPDGNRHASVPHNYFTASVAADASDCRLEITANTGVVTLYCPATAINWVALDMVRYFVT